MTDNDAPSSSASSMPDAPWWSQPTTQTQVLDEPRPTSPPPPVIPPAEPGRRRRRGGAGLLVLALLAAGGTGGAVVAAVDGNGSSTAAAGSPLVRDGAVLASNGTSAVGGTPESAAAAIGPSVVTIEVTGTSQVDNGFGTQAQQVSDTGSGVILRTDGYVLTNNHVVAPAEGGGSVSVTLSGGKTVKASIVGHDATSDLAVLKLAEATGLKAAVFADSEKLKVGQAVLAVGAPLGLANTVTQGIVSTLHRPVATGEPGASAQAVIDAVQTDAAINPGNSGGALVDLAGRVVGINSAIATTGSSGSGQSGNIGVGFAIPSNDAARVADQLIATGHATHSQIGVSVRDTSRGNVPGNGATLGAVTAGRPAATGGLQAGDLVTAIDGRTVTDANSLIVAIRSHDPGSTITVAYTRGGQARTAKVTTASASSD